MRAAPMLPALLRLARLQPGATPNRVRFAIAGLACFRKLPLSHSKKCAIKAILGSWVVGQDEAQAARAGAVAGLRSPHGCHRRSHESS